MMADTHDNQLLLVDDEQGIRTVLGITLTDMGYTVYLAAEGESALALFHQHHPALVITDIKMPGMDGIALLQAIKKARPETEVIMITGHGDIDLAIKSLKFEASDFITKPINTDALEIALQRSRERLQMKRQLTAYTQNLEQLVAEKSRKLIETERMAAIGQTVASLSHTIKNITGGLQGGAFVLEKGLDLNDTTYLRQGWDITKRNVERIARLSMDLLNFAQTSRIQFILANPNTPPKEVADLISAKAAKRHVALMLQLDPQLTDFYFDPDAVYQCLLNLVNNALEAFNATDESPTAAGNCECQIGLKSCAVPGWGVEYRVQDNGCGMAPSILNKLFKLFFTTKGSLGTGVGLMMTKSIIDYHQGTITVNSAPSQGTEFVIRLPLKPDPGNRAIKNRV